MNKTSLQGQPDLQREFHGTQGHTEKPGLKTVTKDFCKYPSAIACVAIRFQLIW